MTFTRQYLMSIIRGAMTESDRNTVAIIVNGVEWTAMDSFR